MGDMSTRQSVGSKDQPVDHKEPGKEQVPLPPHREPLGTGNGGPSWERQTRSIGVAKHTGRLESIAETVVTPLMSPSSVCTGRMEAVANRDQTDHPSRARDER